MDEDDQQATGGHEKSYSDDEDNTQGSPSHRAVDAPAREGSQHGDGQSDASAWAGSNARDRSIHSISTGCSGPASLEHRNKDFENLNATPIPQQRAKSRTSLDDLKTWHQRRISADRYAANASGIALPPSRSSSTDEYSIRDIRRVSKIKSLEQLVVRPEHIALPQHTRERGRAHVRVEMRDEEDEFEELQDTAVREGLQQSLPSGHKRVQQRSRGEAPRRPELSRLWKAVLVALEPSGKLRQNQRPPSPEIRRETSESEAETYRTNLIELATHYSNLGNVSAVTTRHLWSSRIVSYDVLDTQQHGASTPRNLWPDARWAPTYEEFRDTLSNTPAQCHLRMIFVEDLNPSLIDYLGAAFQIPPDVFEKHLDGSGYAGGDLDGKAPARWLNHSSSPGFSSVSWFRPVIPLLPITLEFRNQLLLDKRPKVRCMFEGCNVKHNINLQTTANIWRRNLNLCPSPGAYHKGSETDYPIAWEERVTMCTREVHGCKFVIILLDPLPFTRVDMHAKRDQGKNASKGKFTRQKLEIVRVNPPKARDPHHYDTESWAARQRPFPTPGPDPELVNPSLVSDRSLATSSAPPSPHPLETRPSISTRKPVGVTFRDPSIEAEASRARVSGSAVDTKRAVPLATGPRRRGTRLGVKRIPSDDGKSGISSNPAELKPTDRIDANREESSHPMESLVHIHDRMVPYHPIKAGSSSSSMLGDAFTALAMSSYIKRLQTPFSMIEEFESALRSPGKGKETLHDPLRVLFRIIHDDCHNLTDVVRDSLQRIRQDTLDEDLMQQRVTYWRRLLHRFNSSLAEVDQQLRSFVHFQNEVEIFHSTSIQRPELPSERLARETSQTLRSCLDLVERSSTALLTEMQIVDSRRSIAEAESVSKLTELAFVFIPLSFVASLFSMQVRELGDGVPVYTFVLTAMATVFIAYAMRLGIRSSRLIDYKTRLLGEIRTEAEVPHNQPIPTRIFMGWLHATIGRLLSRTSTKVFGVFFPFLLVGAFVAILLSPIILLWLRGIDRGFTIVITILVLSSNAMFFIPLAKHGYRALVTSPMEIARDLRRGYRENQKRKARAKRVGKHTDPEAQDLSSNSSSGVRIGLRSPVSSESSHVRSMRLSGSVSDLSGVDAR